MPFIQRVSFLYNCGILQAIEGDSSPTARSKLSLESLSGSGVHLFMIYRRDNIIIILHQS